MIGASTQPKTDLGYYKDLAEIQSRFPKGELGWSAKNLATKTVYIWDSVTLGWIDSGEGFPAEEDTLQKLTSATNLWGGGKVSVGITPVEVTIIGTPKCIIITSDKDNNAILYIGGANVTDIGSNALGYLLPGAIASIDYDDTTNPIYVVASAPSQYFWKGALL